MPRQQSKTDNQSFPEWLPPMAATLTQDRFTGDEWLFEQKFDGIRLLAYKNGKDVKLFSRNRLLKDIPVVSEAVKSLPAKQLILDGEITWGGNSVGASLRGRPGSERGAPTEGRPYSLSYHVFDCMWLDGRNLTSLPLETRLEILNKLPLKPPLYRVETLADELPGELPWQRAAREGWEGVIAKRRGSLYEHRRSPHWLKMKCELAQELVVGGFTDPQGKRVGLGALLVGYFEKHDFVFAGKIGTGFDTKLLLELRNRLDKIEIPKAPFTKSVGLPRVRAHWVKPEIVVQVGFIEWTVHGKLRHPRLLGVGGRRSGGRPPS
jgi:DNA ligase D-like protein (predicted ligase)